MKNFLYFLLFVACLIGACKPDDPAVEPIEEQCKIKFDTLADKKGASRFLHDDKFLFLQESDHLTGNMRVFELGTQSIVADFRMHGSEAFGLDEDHIFAVEDHYNNPDQGIVKMSRDGRILEVYNSSNSCLPQGIIYPDYTVLDAKGNIWLNVFTIDNNEPVSWHASGLIRFNPATNTCTVWDTTNSKIPSNSVYNIKEREGTIYFLSDNSSKLVKFENDEFTIIKEAPVSHPEITRYFLWPDGTINYLVKAEKVDEYTYERTLLKDESGRNVFLGLSPDHFFSNNLFFHKDSERNTYILDSPNEPDIYPGYAFTRNYPFISKNGEVLVGPGVGEDVFPDGKFPSCRGIFSSPDFPNTLFFAGFYNLHKLTFCE